MIEIAPPVMEVNAERVMVVDGVVVMESNGEVSVISVNAQLVNDAVTSPERVMREDEC